jgi:hypothetical protein
MANYNTTNIKDLPQLEEVVEGNYLIIENEIGTNIIDFADFVVGPNNVSFYNVVQTLSTRSISMSATVDSKMTSLSSGLLDTFNSKFNSVTANYPRFFAVYPNTLNVPSGLSRGQVNFNSSIDTFTPSDINVVPTNDAASKMSWVLLLSSTVFPGNPQPYTYTITISSSVTLTSNATFETKALKFY